MRSEKVRLRDWLAELASTGKATTEADDAPRTIFPKVSAVFVAEHEHRRTPQGHGARFGGWDGPGSSWPTLPDSRSRLPGLDLPDDAYDPTMAPELPL